MYTRTNGNLFATYFVSAFWHGFYPGYYLFFMSLPLMTFCERMGRSKLTPVFGKNETGRFGPWGICSIIATQVILCYCAIPFILLSAEWSFAAWRQIHFAGHWAMLVFLGICFVMPGQKKDKSDKKKKA